MKLDFLELTLCTQDLSEIINHSEDYPIIISCINAWSFYCYHHLPRFINAIDQSINLADGISIVIGAYITRNIHINRITGIEVLNYFLNNAEQYNLSNLLFLGASEEVLGKIKKKLSVKHALLNFYFISPPFKREFSNNEITSILNEINNFKPQVIFVGLSAPKQEIFSHENLRFLPTTKFICNIGAAFDFYAGTEKMAPRVIRALHLEGLFRYLFHPLRHLLKDVRSIPFLIYKLLIFKININ